MLPRDFTFTVQTGMFDNYNFNDSSLLFLCVLSLKKAVAVARVSGWHFGVVSKPWVCSNFGLFSDVLRHTDVNLPAAKPAIYFCIP